MRQPSFSLVPQRLPLPVLLWTGMPCMSDMKPEYERDIACFGGDLDAPNAVPRGSVRYVECITDSGDFSYMGQVSLR